MEIPEISVIQIVDSRNESYKIQVEWGTLTAKFTLYTESSIWVGHLTKESADEFKSNLGMDEVQYFSTLKKCFGSSDGNKEFTYDFMDDVLSWSKDVGDGLNVVYGQVFLQVLTLEEVIRSVVFPLLECNKKLELEVQRLKIAEDNYTREVEDLSEALNRSKERKNIMEKALYLKFVLLLNEKKRLINKLQRQNSEVGADQEMDVLPGTSKDCF